MRRRVSSADTSLAGRVRYLRAQRGWSRSRLATEAGVSDGWLSALEQDRIKKPDPCKLQQIARALGTTLLDLASLAGYPDLPPIPAEIRDLIVLLCGMPAPKRAKLLRMIAILLEPNGDPPKRKPPEWRS